MVKRPHLALQVAGALAASALLSAAAPDPRIAQVENGLRPPVLVEGDKTWTLAERMRHYGVEGVSIAVIRDSKLVVGEGLRPRRRRDEAARDARRPSSRRPRSASRSPRWEPSCSFRTASSRSTDDINKFLKGWKVPANAHTAKAPVTLERLLSHTAGLTVHGFPGLRHGSDGSDRRAGPRRHSPGEHGRRARGSGSGRAVPVLRRRLHGRAARDDGRHGPGVSGADAEARARCRSR